MNKKFQIKIAPSILSANFLKLGEEILTAQQAGADSIHIDVMDGHFVPNITVGPVVLKHIRRCTNLPLDVHLMIDEPERYLEVFASAGADYLYVHQEATNHLHRAVMRIKELKKKAAVAVNPATPVELMVDIIEDIDRILIMTVNPGFGGQNFIHSMLNKISRVREIIDKRNLSTELEVDGGISHETVKSVLNAGASHIVAGAYVFGSGDIKTAIENLRKAASGE